MQNILNFDYLTDYFITLRSEYIIKLIQFFLPTHFNIMADEEFQILISTQDFLKLQSKYQALQMINQQLIKQQQRWALQLLDMTKQKYQIQKKSRLLTEQNKYLSLQGIKMAQKLLDINYGGKIKTMEQISVQCQLFCHKCDSVTSEIKNFEKKSIRLQKQLMQTSKDSLIKYRVVETQLQAVKNKVKQLQKQQLISYKQKEKILLQNKLLQQQKNKERKKYNEMENTLQSSIHKIKKLQQEKQTIQNQHNKIKLQIKQYQQTIKYLKNAFDQLKQTERNNTKICLNLQKQLQNKNEQLQKINKQILQINKKSPTINQNYKLLQDWSIYTESKVQKDQGQLNFYINLVTNLSTKIQNIQSELKDKNQIINIIQYQNQLRIKQLEAQIKNVKKKSLMETKIESIHQIQTPIQEFFNNFIIKLVQAGNNSQQQIIQLIKSQEAALKEFISQTAKSLRQNSIKKSKSQQFFKKCFLNF